jgi:tetratricopeptide (TPR) repeat protein
VGLRTNLSVGVDVRRLTPPTPTNVGVDVRRLTATPSAERGTPNPDPTDPGRIQSLVTSTPTPPNVGVDVRRLQSTQSPESESRNPEPASSGRGQSLVTSTPTPPNVAVDVRRLQSTQSPESESRNPEPASLGRGQSLVTSTPTPPNVAVDVRRLQSPSPTGSAPGRNEVTGDRYELTLTLHDLQTGQPRWSETFSGSTNDLVELEWHALAKVVSALGGELTPARAGQIAQLLTNNLEALRYLRDAEALYQDMGSSQLGASQAMRLTQRALRLDPLYVDADYCDMYMLRNVAQERLPAEAWPGIAQHCDRILNRDDTHARTLDQRSGYALIYQGDWQAFDALSDRCVQALSGSARHFFTGFFLRINGHFDEARIEQARSEDPEPTDLDSRYFMTASRWADHRYDEGIRAARRSLELHPRAFDVYLSLAHCQVAKGDYPEGLETIRAAQAIWNRQELTALLGFAYARMGQAAEAREVVQELLDQQTSRPYLQPYFVARVYAALGEKQAALDWLEKAAADRSEYLFYVDWGGLRTDLAWDSLQDEPRYWQLCDRLGLGKGQWPRPITPPK